MDIILCMDTLYVIVLKYTLFAIIASCVNLCFQYLSFIIYEGDHDLTIAMLAGTVAGLITKYTLDRNYIFYSAPGRKNQQAGQFILYAMTGALITMIFWIFEIIFDRFIENANAKYLGAIIGLSIGYTSKYLLDKKYVFKEIK